MPGTGSGKSLLFQTLPFIIRNTIISVIITTLALIEDQYQWMKKYGILVVALTANIIPTNFIVWKKVEVENYAIFLVSLEVLLQYASVFFFCIVCNKYNIFNKCLA